MDLDEKKKYCSLIFMQWFAEEKNNRNMDYTKEDNEFINNSFISQVILKKFKVFNIKIHLPIHLLMILSLCTEENPGQSQIILKRLLLDIKSKKGPIPENYVITFNDFDMCFQDSFPIMDIPAINESYHILWNEQKKKGKIKPKESDNLCDTIEWWKEVTF